MSHGKCKTVTIESSNGALVINESDFNEKEHKLFKAKAVKAVKAEKPAKAVKKED